MTGARVKKLTDTHLRLLDEVREEWIGHGLSTAPADRREAVAGVHDVYRAAGLDPPRDVIWAGSPFAGLARLHPLWAKHGDDDRIRVNKHDYFHPPFRRKINDHVESAVTTRVAVPVSFRVAPLRMGIFAQLQAQVSRRIAECESYGDPEGQFDADDLSEWDTHVRLGVKPCPRVAGMIRIARSAGPWWPLRDVVVVCERPSEIHYDTRDQPHREDGPAITYPDGWGVHCWHGTRVPADLIEGGGWSIGKIVRERNSEIRRCAVERVAAIHGWPELIRRAGWHQVGTTVPDPGNPGQTLSLYRVPDIYDRPVNLLLMTNGTTERDGTRRRYAETVPERLTDPIDAAAWQIGVSGSDYRQTVRRT